MRQARATDGNHPQRLPLAKREEPSVRAVAVAMYLPL